MVCILLILGHVSHSDDLLRSDFVRRVNILQRQILLTVEAKCLPIFTKFGIQDLRMRTKNFHFRGSCPSSRGMKGRAKPLKLCNL